MVSIRYTQNNFDPVNRSYRDISQNRQQRNTNATEEGVLVNNFYSQGYGSPIIVPDLLQEPKDLYIKKAKISKNYFSNPLVPILLAPLVILGGGFVLSRLYRNAFTRKISLDRKNIQSTISEVLNNLSAIKNGNPIKHALSGHSGDESLPSVPRIVNINKDSYMALYQMLQDPTPRAVLAAFGVIVGTAVTFIMKNFVDGVKEIWVKKQEADIKRDFEESMIEIENRSFSGKIQILRNMTAKYLKELNPHSSKTVQTNNISSFKGKQDLLASFNKRSDFKRDKKPSSNNLLYAVVSIGAFAASALFSVLIFKNLRSTAKAIEDPRFREETKIILEKTRREIEQYRADEGTRKIKQTIEKTEEILGRSNENIFQPPPVEYGGYPNKIGFNSFVNDITAFLYTFLVHPRKFTFDLFLSISSCSALGYIGTKTIEAIKEVKVKKANTETERQLQDRLVQVELKNFKTKKNSYIAPLVEEYARFRRENAANTDQIEKKYCNIIEEIKYGPPFVYS